MLVLTPLVLLLLVWLWPYIWFRAVKNRLTAEVKLERRQAGMGDEIPITIRIRNLSWLPCPFVEAQVELPRGLTSQRGQVDYLVRATTFLMMRQEVVINTKCYGRARGLQQFTGCQVTLHINEGFGLRDLFVSHPIDAEIVILPGFLPLSKFDAPVKALSGKLEVMRWLHPDESLLRGIRTYQFGDAYKHIAWHASARTGEWMTKQFSSSTETHVAIAINAQMFEPHWIGTRSADFDALCSVATSLTRQLEKQGVHFDFVGNCTIPRDPRRMWHGEQRAAGIRTLLGRAYPYTNASCEELLLLLAKELPVNSPIVLFSDYFSERQWQMLLQLAQRGRTIYVVGLAKSDWPNLSSGSLQTLRVFVAEDNAEPKVAGSEKPSAKEASGIVETGNLRAEGVGASV